MAGFSPAALALARLDRLADAVARRRLVEAQQRPAAGRSYDSARMRPASWGIKSAGVRSEMAKQSRSQQAV
jgi:hypothetical protein